MDRLTHPLVGLRYQIRSSATVKPLESHPNEPGMSSNITDWYDLSGEDKSQVASQIYSPIFTGQMSSRPDLHEKIDISVDHRSARIGAKLADIIRCLWENGMETTGCCENSLGNRIDGSDSAWISFFSLEYAADRFTEFLSSSNIHSVTTKKNLRSPFPAWRRYPKCHASVGGCKLPTRRHRADSGSDYGRSSFSLARSFSVNPESRHGFFFHPRRLSCRLHVSIWL